jgi:hypothetical protein
MVETPGCGSATAFIAKAPCAPWRCIPVMLMQPVGSPIGCNVLRSDLTIGKAISLLHVVNQIL